MKATKLNKKMVTITLTNGQTITGNFPARRADEKLKLGAVFQIWADKLCGTTATQSLCALLPNSELVEKHAYTVAEADAERKICFDKITASGLSIPELFTEDVLINLEK